MDQIGTDCGSRRSQPRVHQRLETPRVDGPYISKVDPLMNTWTQGVVSAATIDCDLTASLNQQRRELAYDCLDPALCAPWGA
jgi:hypothetical protein